MVYLGDFIKGDTVRWAWNSYDSDGASITRATNGTISVYEDGGTTQFTSGITDTEDFDSVTGVHLVAIDTSQSDYEAGKDYLVVLSGATIDGETVAGALFGFSIQNRADTRHLYHTDGILDCSAANSTTVTINGSRAGSSTNGTYDGKRFIVVSGTGAGQIGRAAAAPDGTTYNGSTKVMTLAFSLPTTLSSSSDILFFNDYDGTVTIPNNFGSLSIESDGDLTKVNTLNGHTAQTGDSFARLGAPAGASVSADIAAADTVVDAIKAKTDLLTFTVANVVDANIQRVNDVTIVGDGSGTPFNV